MLNRENSHFSEKNAFRDVFTFFLIYGGDFLKALGKINTIEVLTCSRICGSIALQVLLKISLKAKWLLD